MNIAYFCDLSSIHTLKWINHFSELNNVLVITDKIQKHKTNKLLHGVKVYPILPETFSFFRGWMDKQKTIKNMKQIIRTENIDIIHSMYAVPYSFWAHQVHSDNHIITTRGSDMLVDYNKVFCNPRGVRQRIIYRYFRRLIHRSFDEAKFITSTSAGQQAVIKKFIKAPEKLHLIRTGVDVDNFKRISEMIIRKKNASLILFSPRSMKPIYNIEIILDAMIIIRKEHPDKMIRLTLINDKPDTAYSKMIDQKIKSSGMNNLVTLIPEQSQEQMISHYLNSDIVVMIPDSDGTPVSAIEAMLSKKPLIVGELNYDTDIFNRDTVWKTKSSSARDLAETISELMLLPDYQVSLKVNQAYEVATKFADFNREIKKIGRLYESVITEKVA